MTEPTLSASPDNQPQGGQSALKTMEYSILEKLALNALDEQRKTRRWGIFFKLLTALYILIVLIMVLSSNFKSLPSKFTAVVDLDGPIMADSKANADNIIDSLQAAFEASGTEGVILRVNSPGGSPVQSVQIYDEIKRLREKHKDIPLYVVVEDICASGCYFVAAAANKIFANHASLVGSIGVLMDGYGFVETLKKLGIERRLITAGENKGFLDPFSPLNEKSRQHAKNLVESTHKLFIERVREGRKDKLKETPELFSGLIWTAEQAKTLGLIDEFADIGKIAREVIKAEKLVNFTQKENLMNRLAQQLGAGMTQSVGKLITEKPSAGPQTQWRP